MVALLLRCAKPPLLYGESDKTHIACAPDAGTASVIAGGDAAKIAVGSGFGSPADLLLWPPPPPPLRPPVYSTGGLPTQTPPPPPVIAGGGAAGPTQKLPTRRHRI
ncbi:hypothetical protein [Oryza sativa Japonica Group]|uniref:Uncharacterized protein n=1 Tax=Oryza sativa subsp. japonica TaxID=39947 RepID=Q5QM75_ORYSJ|nr:hypothetical protein [Oryza sativa Japonica Group]